MQFDRPYGAGLFRAMAEDDNDPDSESDHRISEDWPLSTQILAAIAFMLLFILLVAVESPAI